MIRDKETGHYLRSVTNGSINLLPNVNLHPKHGKIWKRRAEVVYHVREHREFYRCHMHRLELVELDLVEAAVNPIVDIVGEIVAQTLKM